MFLGSGKLMHRPFPLSTSELGGRQLGAGSSAFQGRGVSPTEGSCRFPLIVLEQTTQPFLATHNSVIPARPSIRQGEEEPVLLALVIALLEFLVYGSGDLRKHASPNHSRASLNLIVEPGLYFVSRHNPKRTRSSAYSRVR